MGLTGSFGGGKSSVGRILKRLGARKVIDCDRLVHEVFRPRHPVGVKIKALFHLRGRLSRSAIAKEVFSNSRKRRQLEALIHPYVYRMVRSELRRIHNGVVILEVPLLFESGFDRICDTTVAVIAGERRIVSRLTQAGFRAREVRARLRAQLSEGEKKRRADLSIENSGSKHLLVQRTKQLWRKLQMILNEKR